ncbi:DUF7144 family membrane protein [Agromyces mariniharenae]|uniref:DUF7144 domain-containing protein n=1 Tax=Agromyces mariniharenae TaxID=2604423 RepID=A0A5S4V3X3_9MICO|nr:hypothetical protein [Agromyces mariniharenae]TYL53714.1 hypothetical protein FYC51_08690 [Agromyces mariniharenae]
MSDTAGSGWVGWGWFAAIIIIIAGVFDALYGLVAILMPQSSYFVVGEGGLFLFDVSGWGWWHLILGVALVLIGLALITGATWARVVAIILVAFNGLSQLALLPVQPWWSLIVLTLDIIVIYALTVHGRELKSAA